MPMIELTLIRGSLDEGATRHLVEQMTATVARWEGMAADRPEVLSTIWAFVDERPPDGIWTGGESPKRPVYRVRLTVAAGSLDDERKAGLVADITEHILEAEGSPNEPAHAARVWCHIHELPDGNWGAVGKIWRLPEIARFAGIEL